jgi:serine/threonine protein kinase
MEIAPGSVIGGYTFHEKVGHGAFSMVYRVTSGRFGTAFAAKVLRPDIGESTVNYESYKAELTALKTLSHPNIILLFGTLTYESCPILIFEYCPRGSLQTELNANPGRGIPLDSFASISSQLIDALACCHSKGISHCDIKPGNILLDEYGRPKLTDFGIAGLFAMGTMAYVAPELLTDPSADRKKADIWALGVTFVYLLDGELPWPDDLLERRLAILGGEFALERELPSSLKHMIYKMMAVDANARWSAEQLKGHPYFADGLQGELSFRRSVSTMRRFTVATTGRNISAYHGKSMPAILGRQGRRMTKPTVGFDLEQLTKDE